MSSSTSIANGARLDDCHSSIFSLADLNGIKWRKFSASLSLAASPCDDPVLVAFSNCLSKDILAVWRRAPNPKKCNSLQPQITQYQRREDEEELNTSASSQELKKELWIFWWGDEPSVDDIVHISGLMSDPEGSWEDHGLSYECRTLLFKAIHNLVERCLLSENFVRLGKWFLHPYNKEKEEDKSERLSCSFTFFLRGETTVCTTVELARHQFVQTITNQHLQQVINSNTHLDVLLSPYGLKAGLTGVSYKSIHEPAVKKVLEEWKPFYPIHLAYDDLDDNDNDEFGIADSPVPPVVEVILAGVRMNYPSVYVLVPCKGQQSVSCIEDYTHPESTAASINPCDFSSATLPESPAQDDGGSRSKKTQSIYIKNLLSRVVNGQRSANPSSISSKATTTLENLSFFPHESNGEITDNKNSSTSWPHLYDPFKSTRHKMNYHANEEDTSYTSGRHKYPMDSVSSYSEERRKRIDKPNRPRPTTPFHHVNAYQSIPTHAVGQEPINNCYLQNVTLPPYCQDQEEDTHALNNSAFVNIGSETMCSQMFYSSAQNGPSDFHTHNFEELNNNLNRNPDTLSENLQDDSQGTAPTTMEQLHEYVTLWKKFKLPIPAMEEVKQKAKKIAVKVEKPALVTDSLDPQHVISPNALRLLKRMNNNFCDVQRDWSWSAINSKRQKLEEKSSAEESEISHSVQSSSDPNATESQHVVTQHVTVAAVTGELAGMTVPTDPYDFEEDEKDLNFIGPFNTSTADINLKQVGTWANRNSSIAVNKVGNNEVSTSHLESLLTNTNMPLTNYSDQFTQPLPAMENSNLNKLSNNTSLTDKKDIQVSFRDLNHIFNESEDDDNGMPTPPDDHQDDVLDKKVRQNTTGVIETCLPDLHRMFPTPPSLEQQACSPEGKIITNVPKCNISANPMVMMENVDVTQAVNGLSTGGVLNYYDDREMRRLSMKSEKDAKSLSNNAVSFEENKNMQGTTDANPSGVYSVTPLCKLPLPANYLPVKNLPSQTTFKITNKLPQHVLYTPSWQIPLDSYMDMAGNTNMHTGSNSHYNCVSANQTASIAMPPYSNYAQMPASVSSLHSPANFSTPARTPRGENVMASPASSIATPATGGRAHQLTPSVASSAAQSDIYACRASSIYVNLMLSDSVLNLFRDVSFEQCTMCVCNNSINGRDVDLGYLPSIADSLQEGQYSCSCGFSAVRNRCLSVGAGLFLEDEFEIVGKDLENMIIDSRHHSHKISDVQLLRSAIEFALKQSSNPFMRDFSKRENASVAKLEMSNIAVQLDIMEACVEAINGGISVMEDGIQSKIKLHHCKDVVHQWHTSRDILMKSSSSADEYRILQYLKPVLQDAIQKLRPERSYSCTQLVKGPLTWREFCKDNSFASEPLPVPLLLVGHDLDWMTVSPFALNFWEKLYLEPFAGSTNIAYIVICPDVENVLHAAKSFFYELSSLYEHCRLGNHKPYLRILQDSGVLKVKGDATNSSTLPDWYMQIMKMISVSSGQHDSDVDVLECVKQYAQACSQNLVPLLTSQPSLARTDLYTRPPHQNEQGNSNNPTVGKPGMLGSGQSASRPPTPLPQQQQLVSQKGLRDLTQANAIASKQCPSDCATIVIYFVDPFSSKCNSGFLLAIWNCYMDIIKSLPEPLKSSVVVQLVPVEDILQTSIAAASSSAAVVRSLAFSAYVQSRRKIPHNVQVRSMTAFGPAASQNEAISKNINNLSMSSIYAPPFTLAIFKNKQRDVLEQSSNDSNILFVCYCLSHDQKWLLASATDQSGEMLETFCVNIEVPPRRISLHRRQRACIKSEGIQKLWSLCMGAITRTAFTQWRIVIGRLGRLGHGEIQEWSKYLNRSSNLSVMSENVQLRCNQCKLNGSAKHTNIISACLTSLEPEGSFSIFPDFIKSIGRFGRSTTGGTQLQLKTPEDASCSHIYVFPTSSSVQAAGTTFQHENIEFGDLEKELGFALPDLEQDDLTFIDALGDLTDPSTSPNSHPHSADDVNMKRTASENLIAPNGRGEETTLLQQPLALGYLVSTAPTGPLPECFWISCPHAKYKCPVFLKFALHIQASKCEAQNGSGSNDNNENCHQLDSHRTAEVLRYVMENYNALSWLTCNPVTRDRRSCLPLHYFVLARLYNTVCDLT